MDVHTHAHVQICAHQPARVCTGKPACAHPCVHALHTQNLALPCVHSAHAHRGTHTYTHAETGKHTDGHVYTPTYTHIYTCIDTRSHKHILPVHTESHAHTNTHTQAQGCIYTYMHAYTQTLTHTQRSTGSVRMPWAPGDPVSLLPAATPASLTLRTHLGRWGLSGCYGRLSTHQT